jgi:uncharacterized membrane protein YdbT with pleckstrin-like domain
MSYVEELLARNERVARIARDHWVVLLPAILVDAAAGSGIIGLSILGVIVSPPYTWFGLVLLIVPVGHIALRLWDWWNRQYIITNRRIVQITGMVNKRVSDTLLEKINDIVTVQSAMGRLLKFGDIEIIAGTESGVDVFRRIADPVGFKKELLEQRGSLGGLAAVEARTEAAGVGDVPELIAELDALRQKGLITDAEFEEKKEQLLDRI